MKPITLASMLVGIIVTALGGIALTMATTWINPTATPPNNGDIDILTSGGYDGLGNHQATTDLNLTGHRLYGVNNHGIDRALVATSSISNIAALITASNNFGTEVQSQANDQPAVRVRNTGTGYALMASSTQGWAAQFGQALQLATSSIGIPAGIQWGAGSNNYLSTADSGSASANNLYWGKMPLCDIGQPTCGRVKASLGDNLGNHIAQFNLDMMQHSVINLENKIGTVLATSSLQLTHVGVGAANFGPGLNAVSQNVNGIVAINTIAAPAVAASGYNSGSGYGVTGQSIFGPGISLYGRLKLLTEAASTTLPQLTFGKQVHNNSLALTPISPADQNLYWGDKLLCDSTKANCGWSATAGTPSLWSLIGGNLFTDYLVSIGGIGDSAKLEVVTPADITLTNQNMSLGYAAAGVTFGGHLTDIQNGILYTLTDTGMNIYSLTNPSSPVLQGHIDLGIIPLVGPVTLNSYSASIDVFGNYAYIPYRGYLIIIDITNPASNPTPIYFFLGNANFGARRIAVSGKYAYVLGDTLAVVDISNPLNPVIKGSSALNNTSDITVQGDYLYASQGVLDISTPESPNIRVNTFLGDVITVRGHLLFGLSSAVFGAQNVQKLSVFDISDPQSPNLISALDIGVDGQDDQIRSLAVNGRYAYIVHGPISTSQGNGNNYDVSIIDVNNPAVMQVVTEKDFGDWNLSSLVMYGDYGYASNNDVGCVGVPVPVCGDDHLMIFGRLPVSSFANLQLGFGQADSLMASGDLTNNVNMYIRGGVSVQNNVTLSSGTLNSGVGVINIGGVKLDRTLLQKLITWSNS
jgi:hypothetical protein